MGDCLLFHSTLGRTHLALYISSNSLYISSNSLASEKSVISLNQRINVTNTCCKGLRRLGLSFRRSLVVGLTSKHGKFSNLTHRISSEITTPYRGLGGLAVRQGIPSLRAPLPISQSFSHIPSAIAFNDRMKGRHFLLCQTIFLCGRVFSICNECPDFVHR